MATYTSKEIADILFQKPDRVTSGLNFFNQSKTQDQPKINFFLTTIKQAFTNAFYKSNEPTCEPRCITNAIQELKAIGFEDDVINMHCLVLQKIIEQELENSLIYLAIEKGESVFTSSQHFHPNYSLGVKILDVDKAADLALRQNLENISYPLYSQVLENSVIDMPQLVTTDFPRPNTPEFMSVQL